MTSAAPFTPQLTADGSFTFYSPQFGETFHSQRGAKAEADEKFVHPCLLPRLAAERSQLTIIDVCYGLGYNTAAALTAIWQVNPHCHVTLYGLENDLQVPRQAIANGLLQGWPDLVRETLQDLAQTETVTREFLTAHLAIGDARQTLLSVVPQQINADAIFLDPFSPPKCPQLWTVEFLRHLGDRLAPTGRLATYCSAAAVRNGLQLAGLHLATMADGHPPHPRRRPLGTLASRQILPPLDFTPWEMEHLQTKAAIPYRDPLGTDPAAVILARRRAEQSQSALEPTSRWKKRWLTSDPKKIASAL
ncbi:MULTISPECIES: tRNA (5-methylaminomethyl-2-thiouridine)(34)-methyltransferase MnmD [unclassified Synechocystis]|uniref:tRNA (5-methylaminomethyl-2-thiouridine)(34)-methyltransferase MnmD n=1 Tax=unclassified Synechocystis TaxID=2640012 RepID=UPI001CBE1630|nr:MULTISPECIES: MnmC family methyltransferase [unclassified Synechocystis]